MGHVDTARALVAERFPSATAALLAGIVALGTDGPTSDLDIVVVLPPGHSPYRETVRYRGVLAEVFVHTAESVWEFVEREVALRRSPLLHMCATGLVLLDERGVGTGIAARARRLLEAGPPALGVGEREDRRYTVTALIDDLLDAADADADEAACVAAALLTAVGELVIADRGGWLGRGKWLARRLRALAPDLALDLAATFRALDSEAGRAGFARAAGRALDSAGGRLDEGYVRRR